MGFLPGSQAFHTARIFWESSSTWQWNWLWAYDIAKDRATKGLWQWIPYVSMLIDSVLWILLPRDQLKHKSNYLHFISWVQYKLWKGSTYRIYFSSVSLNASFPSSSTSHPQAQRILDIKRMRQLLEKVFLKHIYISLSTLWTSWHILSNHLCFSWHWKTFYHKVSAKQTILCAEFSWGIFCERVNSYVTFASIEGDYLGKPRYSSVTGTHQVPGRN